MVKSIASQRNAIITRPASGDFPPKKAMDHNTLKANWTQKMIRALLTSGRCRPFRQTRNAETPINTNSVIHTGENIQSGGVNDGFLKVRYQVETDEAVKIEPTKPASWQTIMLAASLRISNDLVASITNPDRYQCDDQ